MKKLRLALALLVAVAAAPLAPAAPAAALDVYLEPGVHEINGRLWSTECEPYSQTKRCRTEIMATVVSYINGRFVPKTDWAFNNLTYAPMPRAGWGDNPLANTGTWTNAGRSWRTECDTPLTGQNGCRSFLKASVVESVRAASGSTSYRWVTKEILNNMVRFSPPVVAPTPTPTPTLPAEPGPEWPRDLSQVKDAGLRGTLTRGAQGGFGGRLQLETAFGSAELRGSGDALGPGPVAPPRG